MKEVEIYRADSDLKHVAGEVPSPFGLLSVDWEFEKGGGGGGNLKLEVPTGMQVKLNVKSLKTKAPKLIQVNNRVLSAAEKNKTFTRLEAGQYLIKF